MSSYLYTCLSVLYYNVKFSPKVQSPRGCFCINKTKLLLKSVMSTCIWLCSQVDCNFIISILYLCHVSIDLCDHTIIQVYAMLSYDRMIIPSYRSMPCYHRPVWSYHHTGLCHVIICLCDHTIIQVYAMLSYAFVIIPSYKSMLCYHMPVWSYHHTGLCHVIICLCDHTIIQVYAMLSYACVIIPSYRSMPCCHMFVGLYHTAMLSYACMIISYMSNPCCHMTMWLLCAGLKTHWVQVWIWKWKQKRTSNNQCKGELYRTICWRCCSIQSLPKGWYLGYDML